MPNAEMMINATKQPAMPPNDEMLGLLERAIENNGIKNANVYLRQYPDSGQFSIEFESWHANEIQPAYVGYLVCRYYGSRRCMNLVFYDTHPIADQLEKIAATYDIWFAVVFGCSSAAKDDFLVWKKGDTFAEFAIKIDLSSCEIEQEAAHEKN